MEGIKVDPTKIKIIINISVPRTQKEVHSFLGHTGYYRHFIEHFSRLACPLFILLSKDAIFNWTD